MARISLLLLAALSFAVASSAGPPKRSYRRPGRTDLRQLPHRQSRLSRLHLDSLVVAEGTAVNEPRPPVLKRKEH